MHLHSSSNDVGGLIPPIPTPFADGRLDTGSLAALLDYLGDHVDGVLLGGSVGELASLTLDERLALMRALARYRDRGKRLAVSVADNSIENTRMLAEAAAAAGADLLMVSCPGYFHNSIDMLEHYFGAISELAPVDICLYDNPVASHTQLSIEAVARIARAAPRVTAVKVTDTALGKVAALRDHTDLTVFAGDDAVLWQQLADGADGAMVALPMIFPEQTARMRTALDDGRAADALDTFRGVATFIHVGLGAHDYPAVIKAVLHERGVLESAEVRLPLTSLSTARRRQILDAVGTAGPECGAAGVL